MNVIYGGGDVGEWLVTDDRRERDRVRRLAQDGGEDRPRRGVEADADRGVAATGRSSCARTRISSSPRRAPSTARSTAPARFAAATERVLVDGAVHEEFQAAVVREAEGWKLGDPFDDATLVGPMQNEPTAQKMDAHLEDAVAKGAEVVVGGRARIRPADASSTTSRRCVANVGRDTLVNRDETFGPIVPLISVDGDDDALAVANESHLGLQAAVYTRDLARAFRFAERAAGRQRRRERLDRCTGRRCSRSAARPGRRPAGAESAAGMRSRT